MSSGDCRWLADSVLKNRTSKERLCVVLCSDNDVLVPVVVQKQQGRTLHVGWVHGNRSSPGTEGEDRGLPYSLTLLRTPKHSWGWRRQGPRARQG